MRGPLAALALLLTPLVAVAGGDRTGEQIFRSQCAACHGQMGEGTDENFPHPLQGDRTVEQLARLIARTMPKKAPQKCPPEDAAKVAAYIYEAFYSPEAQVRNRPPRVELSRLTVRQYREAVADLVGSFRTSPLPSPRGGGSGGRGLDDQRGLRGEYFNGHRFRSQSRILERLDPEVRFDFGTGGPAPEKFDPHLFAIRWAGSVLAPETGDYEFVVRTEHAVRLWVNDTRRPLIDAWVKSGNETEYHASIFLLGGRAYPLRLEFAKGKQGVADSGEKEKPKDVKASISLEWQLPRRAAEVIPARDLSPNPAPEVFLAQTAFPPDDRSLGWERGTSVSRAWDQAITDAAIEAAGYVVAHLAELSGVRDEADRGQRLRVFCRQFAERAFRRPLGDDLARFFIESQFERAGDPETAVKRVVLLVLSSPRFLYPEAGGAADGYAVASRLSFGLWDSVPDSELLQAAAAGKLATREQVATQAERMLGDPRARAKLREFLLQWLKVDQVPDLAKDPKLYPGFDPAVVSDLRTSLDLFLEDVVWGESSDFRQLFLADSLYLNGRLARFYGADLPADAPFRKISLQPGERAGVLTHPYLLATFAYTGSSSPIHRGVFLARNVLGLSLRPPPQAFTPLPAALHPELTTRERVALQTRPQACLACHGVINPLGFTLEHFDAIGRYRDKENGRPIDATGIYETRSGEQVKFNGVRDLATFLAGSEEVQDAFVERVFQHEVKQPVRAFGPRILANLRQVFVRDHYNIRKLLVEIMAMSALRTEDDKRQEVGKGIGRR